jgi:MarR family transcriptional regulator, organic hydroperoxide resistance regulator
MDPEGTSLQQELRQTRPFRSPGEESVISILHTADVLRRDLSRVTEPRGITLQQYNVLRILRGAGDRDLPTLVIAERMVEQTPGITRLLNRLEAKGLVVRHRGRSDRRQVLCRLTAEGRAILERIDPEISAATEAQVAMLGLDEKMGLLGVLAAIRAARR